MLFRSNPNKRRYVEIYKSGNRTERDELIQIGEAYYCRTNDGIWKKSNQWCGELRISSLPMATSSKFTIEDTKINNQAVKLYQQYITYKNEYSSNKAKEGLSYFQDKFWVDSNGFILRREWELGLLEPKKTYETMVTIYEYNPKDLKIEAPKMTRKKS